MLMQAPPLSGGAGDAVSIAPSGGSVKLAKAALGDKRVKNGFRKELKAKKLDFEEYSNAIGSVGTGMISTLLLSMCYTRLQRVEK
jgi:hypothetical protein